MLSYNEPIHYLDEWPLGNNTYIQHPDTNVEKEAKLIN